MLDRRYPVHSGWMWRALHGDLGIRLRPAVRAVRGAAAVGNTVTAGDCRASIGFTLGLVLRPVAGYFRDTGSTSRDPRSDRRLSVPHYCSAWCWSSSSRCSSTGCPRSAPVRGLDRGVTGAHEYLILPAIRLVIPMGHRHPHGARLDRRHLAGFRRGLRPKAARADVFVTSIKNARRPRLR